MQSNDAYLISKPYADGGAATERDIHEYWSGYSDAHVILGHHAYLEETYRVHAVRQDTSLFSLHTARHEGRKEVRRTVRHTQQDPNEDYLLWVVTKGEDILFRQRDVEAVVKPGTAILGTPAEPFDVRIGRYSGFVLKLPCEEINDRLGGRSPLEAGFDFSKGLGRLIADMLRSLYEERSNLTELEFNAACTRLVELLCMLMVGDTCPDTTHVQDVEAAVRRYVHQHAGNPELSLNTVAAALGWSPRRLQSLMSEAGTTYRDLVREERLMAARRMLGDPAMQHLPIMDIAGMCGFASGNVLSILWRERYGETPREYRHRALGKTRPLYRPAGLPVFFVSFGLTLLLIHVFIHGWRSHFS